MTASTYELLVIADGTKTVEQTRGETNVRKVKHRQSVRSRTDNAGQPSTSHAVAVVDPDDDDDAFLEGWARHSRLPAPRAEGGHVVSGRKHQPPRPCGFQYVYDGRELFAVLELKADGWHVIIRNHEIGVCADR